LELANAPLFFWVVAGILTIGAVGSALWPFIIRNRDGDGATPGSTEGTDGIQRVLIDQLDEINRDLERGLIEDEDAKNTHAEVARRLLALEREKTALPQSHRPDGVRGVYRLAMIAIIPLASLSLYSVLGAPGRPDQPIAARVNEASAEQAEAMLDSTLDPLVKQVEAHLAKNPDDVRGWQTIAPVYLRQNKLDKAEEAFRRALAIGGDDTKVTGSMQNGLGQVLAIKASGLVNEEALELFRQAQKNTPDDPIGFFFEALALSQAEKRDQAIVAWQGVITRFEEKNPPWLPLARRTLASLQSQTEEQESLFSAPANSSPQAVEDARNLGAEERNELIESMVAGLAAKLEDNPNDLPGWRRLIRSYMVLGKKNDAMAALAKARATFEDNPQAKATLDATATEHNL